MLFASWLVLSCSTPSSAQTWSQISATGAAPSGRIYSALTFDSARSRAVLFGGLNGSTEVNDTWEWDPAAEAWSQRFPATAPTPRQVMAFAYDASRERTVVWGGFANNSFLAETWEWDGSNWSLVANGPMPGRCGAAMVYDSQRQKCILFGGQGISSFSNDIWEWDGSNWAQVVASTTSAPSPRFYHGMVYDARRGRVVVFGGSNGVSSFNDTWTWTPGTATWAQIASGGPSVRSQAGMIYDPSVDRVVLYGGEAPSTASLGDLWLLEGNGWTAASVSAPPARRRQAMVFLDGLGTSLMFGGQQSGGVIGETWKLSTSEDVAVAPYSSDSVAVTNAPLGLRDFACAPLPAGGSLVFGGTTPFGAQPFTYTLSGGVFTPEFPKVNPIFRTGHTLLLDPVRQNNVMFGGRNPAGAPLADTWTWENDQWNHLPQSTRPSARSGHKMAFDRSAGLGLLFGGEDALGAPLGDFWSWDGASWTQLAPSVLPPARARHGMAFDELRGRTVVFGGRANGTRLEDVWEWDGANWIEGAVAVHPSERHGTAMSYDAMRNRMVAFGGRDNSGFFAETWELGTNVGPLDPGQEWQRVPAALEPSPRNSGGQAFDPTRNVTVLFGGFDGNHLNDTWTYDGVTWTIRVPATSPSVRSGTSMIFDAARGKVVLFGGFNPTTFLQNDTWTWDGVNWTQVVTPTSPPPRLFAQLAYDSARQRVVLFGGNGGSGSQLADTWEFDGVNWSLAAPAGAGPTARQCAMLCYDPVRNETVLFGGGTNSVVDSQTWVWNGAVWTQRLPATSPSPRWQGAMAFDPQRSRVVLFGGATAGWASNFGDTWEWNGLDWQQVNLRRTSANVAVGARDSMAMAYSPHAERIVLQGGEGDAGCLQDFWSWDGTAWEPHASLAGPYASAREGGVLFQDQADNRLLLLGGGCGSNYYSDLWQIDLPVYARADSFGAACAGPLGPVEMSVVGDSKPIMGTNFDLRMYPVPGFSPCLGFIGASNQFASGVPLPIDLGFVGAPGCFAHVSAEIRLIIGLPSNATLTMDWSVGIPQDPVLLGLHFYFQGLALLLNGGRVTTNGIDAKIGDR